MKRRFYAYISNAFRTVEPKIGNRWNSITECIVGECKGIVQGDFFETGISRVLCIAQLKPGLTVNSCFQSAPYLPFACVTPVLILRRICAKLTETVKLRMRVISSFIKDHFG
jgi:hypothetical protein